MNHWIFLSPTLFLMTFWVSTAGFSAENAIDPAPPHITQPLLSAQMHYPDSMGDHESKIFEFRTLGDAALRSGFYEEAVRYYQDYLTAARLWPTLESDAALALAEAQICSRNFTDAAETLKNLRSKYKKSDAIPLKIPVLEARIALNKDHFQEALALVSPLTTATDTMIRADALAVMIAVRQREGDWTRASVACSELMDLIVAGGMVSAGQLNYAMNRQIYFDIRRGAYVSAGKLLKQQIPKNAQEQCENTLLNAFFLCSAGYLDNAITHYRLARQLNEFRLSPLTTGIACEIAEKLVGAGRVTDAEDILRDAFGTAENAAVRQKILRRIAEIQLSDGNTKGAVSTLMRYQSYYPDAPDAVVYAVKLAQLHHDSRDDTAAFAVYEKLLSQTRMDSAVRADVLRRYARILSDAGEYDSARRRLAEMVKMTVDSVIAGEGLYLTAETWVKQRQFSQALSVYTLLASNPAWRVQGLYRKMIMESELNLFEEALKTIPQIRAVCTDSVILSDVSFFYPHILSRWGKYAEAELAYRQFITAFPEHFRIADALMELGEAHMKLRQYRAADKVFGELILRFPENINAPRAQYQQIYAASYAGNDAEAVNLARQFPKRWAKSDYVPEALFWLSDYYRSNADAQSALSVLNQIIALKNLSASAVSRARLEKAHVLSRHAHSDSALAEIVLITSSDIDNPYLQDAAYLEGEILSGKHMYQEAVLSYRKAYEVRRNSPVGVAAAGRIGDCLTALFSVRAEFSERYLLDAKTWYERVLNVKDVPAEIRSQTLWKIGHIYHLLQDDVMAVSYFMRPLLQSHTGGDPETQVWNAKCADSLLQIYKKRGTPESAVKAVQLCRMMMAAGVQPLEYWQKCIDAVEMEFRDAFSSVTVDSERMKTDSVYQKGPVL